MRAHDSHHENLMGGGYGKLVFALLLSLLVKYPLTVAFVVRWSDVYLNLGNAYMALMIVALMGLIVLLVMRGMFPNKRLKTNPSAGFVMLFIAAFNGSEQVIVGNEQFLRSVIPHHSRAILVREEASITDPEIQELCGTTIQSQEEEIEFLKEMLGD